MFIKILSLIIAIGIIIGASYTAGLRKGHENGVEFERWRVIEVEAGRRLPNGYDIEKGSL